MGNALMAEDHHHHVLKVNGDKSRGSLVASGGNHHQHESLHHHSHHQDSGTGLPGMLHHQQDDAMDSLAAADSDSVIPTPVVQHGMAGMCGPTDDRYGESKYPKYDKYGDPGMEFNALSQRYLAGDMNIGGQGQLLGPAIGLHGFKDATAYATLASHPFSIQRLLPGAADAKSDVKMFEMGPYGGYATLGPAGHGKFFFNLLCV